MRDDGYRTNLEKAVAEALDELGAEYREQEPVRAGFVLDFVVKTSKGEVCVEADGPTHSTKEGKKRDRFRDLCLRRAGWRVYHLDQDLILDPDRLRARVSEIIG